MSRKNTGRASAGRARQRAQERAHDAWRCVEKIARASETVKKRYGTLARKLPSLLQGSGLGQTVAFLYAKSKDPEGKEKTGEALLLEHVLEHLRAIRSQSGVTESDAMALILDFRPSEYRRATRELMAFASWLKRFAEGALGQEDA